MTSIPPLLNLLKKNYFGNFQIGRSDKLPYKNNFFDTVFLTSIIEHLNKPHLSIKEALRVGRRVVITVPQPTPTKLKNRGLLYLHYQDKTHRRNYTTNSLSTLITQSGGKIIGLYPTEKLPVREILFEFLKGPVFIRKLICRLFFLLFPSSNYYLELTAVIKKVAKLRL